MARLLGLGLGSKESRNENSQNAKQQSENKTRESMGTDWFRTEFVNGSVNQEERRNPRPGGIPRTNLRVTVISDEFIRGQSNQLRQRRRHQHVSRFRVGYVIEDVINTSADSGS
jgi:hypothetical protein